MQDHRSVTAQNSTPGPRLNRAQRRQRSRRRTVMGERITVRPYHQTWTFTEASDTYVVTADAGVNRSSGHQVTILCTDRDDEVHGTWRTDEDRPPDDCVHVALLANHIVERDDEPWRWGDDAA